MTTTITRTTAPPVPLDETEAAQLEGLAPMPSDLVPLRERKLQLANEIAALEEELEQIKGTFNQRMKAAGVVGFTLLGKVRSRISTYDHPWIDQDDLRTRHPRIYKSVLRKTPVESTKIT